MNKEAIVGLAVVLVILGIIVTVTGTYGIIVLGITFILAVISINLFSRKSVATKIGAVIVNTDLIYKMLMPRKHKKAIKELEEKESHE